MLNKAAVDTHAALEAMLRSAGMDASAQQSIRLALKSDPQLAQLVAETLALTQIATFDFSTARLH